MNNESQNKMRDKSDIKPYYKVLKQNRIFAGMTDLEIEEGLDFFSSRLSFYQKGEMLNIVTEPLMSFGIVLKGLVHVCKTDFEGEKFIMSAVSVGDGFGEALSFLGLDTDVYIKSAEDSYVLWLSTDKIKNAPSQRSENNLYIQRFIADLAERALMMNERIQIMSKKTLREKLLTMFSSFSTKAESTTFTLPFDRNGMAVYLGTDRSSLSRELSKMSKEGIIRFHKNKFEIL